MAAESPLTTVSTYGAAPEDIADWQKAQEAGIKALEQRYANPNWFNVAAGFFKPQLGGFAASLGSAAQAMGENVEKERETQLPIAKMRAELAASRIGMSKEMAASKAFSEWKASNKPMDEATYSQIVGLAPNSSVAKAAEAAYKGEREGQTLATQQQTLRSSQYGQALTAAQQKFQAGAMSRDEYVAAVNAAEQAYGPTKAVTPTRPAGGPGTTFPAEVAASVAAPSAAAAPVTGAASLADAAPAAATPVAAGEINVPVLKLGPNAPRSAENQLAIFQQELNTAFPKAAAGDVRAQGDVAALIAEARRSGATIEGGAAGPTGLTPSDLGAAVSMLGGSTAGGPAVRGGPAAADNRAAARAPADAASAAFDGTGARAVSATAAKPAQKIVISSPFAPDKRVGLTPAAVDAQVALNESAAKAKFDTLDKVAGPDNYKPARRVIEDQMALIKNNPELAKKVTAILNRGDLSSQIKTAAEEGIGLNLGGIAGQIKLPVKKVELAGFNKREQEMAQTMANNYAKIAIFQQRVGNVNPNAASNMEAQMYKDLTPTMDTTPNAALRALGHLLTDLDSTHARYKFANEVYYGRHPNVSLAAGVPDKYSAILSHPAYDAVYEPFSQDHKDLEAAFQKRLAPAPKKP